MPTFSELYDLLLQKGPGRAISSKKTHYRVEAINAAKWFNKRPLTARGKWVMAG